MMPHIYAGIPLLQNISFFLLYFLSKKCIENDNSGDTPYENSPDSSSPTDTYTE